ncbi:hypothetical protein C2S52_014257 [Perilla frutescens var. hirtella]|nr:hypothetical protein C2S51_016455 [Perilla frutescens var. frutescens]KAH6776696.1 hypothetical protein C2S52_014257 [Perilla frutescens var. hirtella]
MGQDFFTYLPSEIIVNILSRLPIRSIIWCKRVCKSWLDLLVTPEFVSLQLQPPFSWARHSAANGLLFLWEPNFLICNPITRDYIMLPYPLETSPVLLESCGFGVSRISGQYKVVGMFFKMEIDALQQPKFSRSECQVYSVGTGYWRRIASAGVRNIHEYGAGAFLNGNLHWLAHARDLNGYPERISCFDLETELFSTSSPPPPPPKDSHRFRNLSVLGGCLCLCDNLGHEFPSEFDIVIWLMKEYGDEKSWTKEFVIRKMFHADICGSLCPIKVFEDGDILMEMARERLLYYSNKTKTFREVDVSGPDCTGRTTAISYTPSFLPLKTIAIENVVSF